MHVIASQTSSEQQLPSYETRVLAIDIIRRDGETQGRVVSDPSVVQEYATLIKLGVEFPPLRVWFDGEYYWLSDGFQRTAAAGLVGIPSLPAVIFRGSIDDARWDSYAANGSHGLRRTRSDIEAVVQRTLEHPRAMHLSTREIARHLSLPEATVRRWRRRSSASRDADEVRTAKRNGATYLMNTSRIGQAQRRSAHVLSSDTYQNDLKVMKELGSPQSFSILSLVEKWLRGAVSAMVCLEGIEDLLHPK
jgi:hypothetical protein